MKKYKKLIEKKNKLEEKIALLCNKFTNSTGIIVRDITMDIDIFKKIGDDKDYILPKYKANINCEV